jgi:hemolysin III
MAAMFAASALYHAARPGRLKAIARRVDHALIFAAIAGTYTPLLALRLDAPFGDLLCLSAWLVAGVGIALKIVAPRRSEKPGTALYLALGWAGLAVAIPLGQALQPLTSALIIGGCVVYTAGAGAYRARHFRFQTALWHASVLVAASVHFTAMAVEFTPRAA